MAHLENRLRLGVSFELLQAAASWETPLARWREFIEAPSTLVGFWCDPRVMRSECGAGAPRAVLVAQVERAGRLVALVPFKLGRDQIPLRLGLARLGSVRAERAVLYDAPFAVAPGEDRTRVLERVLAELAGGRRCDLAVVSEWVLPAEGGTPFAGAIARRAQTSYRIVMPATVDAYLGAFKRSTRHKLRGQVHKLERTMDGHLTVRCYRLPEHVPEFSQLAQRVWERSWHSKLDTGTLPGLEFLQDMAERGWLRAYVMLGRDAPLAFALGYQYRGVFSYQNTGYDPEYEAYSPGTVLNFLFIQELFTTDPPEIVDFGFGENQYKLVLCNDKREQADFWLPMTVRGHVVAVATQALDAAYRSGKGLLQRTRLRQQLKRYIRTTKPVAEQKPEGGR